MDVRIQAVAKQLPPYTRSTEEILPYVKVWLGDQDERLRRKALKIFSNAGVDRRYSIIDADDMFVGMSFEERNDIYATQSVGLAGRALQKALDKTDWVAADIDFLITVSCTGIMIPSVDAYLINNHQLRQDVVRLPVTEMGCAAGVSGMIYAHQFLKANPGKRAAVIAVESPMATFQLSDFSMVNIVSAAIFGDGAACVLLSSEEEAAGPRIVADDMYHFFDATEMMGFQLKNEGLFMVLDQAVPGKIAEHFPRIVHPFLEKNKVHLSEVDHLIFHPGGRKIIQTVEVLFGTMGKNIDDTREVLRQYGNMSSVTILYVLERFLNKKITSGEKGLMLSFGPGFSAQSILLEW